MPKPEWRISPPGSGIIFSRYVWARAAIEVAAENGKVDFKRRYKHSVFARAMDESASAVKKLFTALEPPVLIGGNQALWKTVAGPWIRMTTLPAERFAGYAVWDTPNMKTPTFEPFFHPVTIPAGESVTYELQLQAEK